jgi:4-amino-4-deoxy-L-arabinose transferase-like glycosyltransferase
LTPDRRTLLALFSLAFGLRILYAAVFGDDPSIVGVHETYDFRVAARMAHSVGWISQPFSPSAPGYLIVLATAFKFLGVSWWTAVLLNAGLGAMTTLFLYRIGERLLGRGVGLVSALWLGLFVHHMLFASLALRYVLVTFLTTWLAYTLARPFYRMRTALWTAFLCTLLVHTEPMFLVLIPLLVLFLALRATHHRYLSIQYVFLFVCALFAYMTPWTVRNFVVHRDVVVVSLEATRYTSPIARFIRDAPAQAAPPEASAGKQPGFFQHEREFWRVVRLEETAGDPERRIAPERAWSLRHNLTNVLNYGLLLPFFVAGVLFAWTRRQRPALVLASIVFSYAIVCGFFGAGDGSRLVVEPLIVSLACYGAKVLLDMRRAAGEPAEVA